MIFENERTIIKICGLEVLLGGGAFCLFWCFPYWTPVIFLVFLLGVLGLTAAAFRKVRKQVNHTMELVDDTIDQLILGRECRYFDENEDDLLGKFQSQILRLYQIRKAYQEKERLQKEQLEQSISDLVHQINTPIANLKLYGDFLGQEELTEEERKKFAASIKSQTRKLQWLGEGFGKISRMEQGMIQLRPKNNPVLPALLSAVGEITPKAMENQNEIRLSGGEHVTAWFDPRWTEEVFFNLLDNGTKYGNFASPIQVTVENYELHVKVSVTTQGNLPRPEEIPRLFQRFYRGAAAGSKEGVGLGLYLAREIVQRQNGYMKAEFEKDDKITFYVFLRKEEETDETYFSD